jgi:hypothetical protein
MNGIERLANLGSEGYTTNWYQSEVSTLSLDGPVERSLDRKL